MKSHQKTLNACSNRTGPVYGRKKSRRKNSDPEVKDPLPAFTEENLPARREWFLKFGFDRHFDGVCG